MIEINNISKTFGDRNVVSDVSFTFETGKTNLIIGESGSGKTTILKMMVGLLAPDQGKVMYDGRIFLELEEQQKQEAMEQLADILASIYVEMTEEQRADYSLPIVAPSEAA